MSNPLAKRAHHADFEALKAYILAEYGLDSQKAKANPLQEASVTGRLQEAFEHGGVYVLEENAVPQAVLAYSAEMDEPHKASVLILEMHPGRREAQHLAKLLDAAQQDLAEEGISQLEISQPPHSYKAILLDTLTRSGLLRFKGKTWLNGLTYRMDIDARMPLPARNHAQVKQVLSGR